MLMENFHPPHLEQNTSTNEAHNQLNIWLQEMLDKCVTEKIVKRPEKPQNLWFNNTLQEQWKIVKNRERTWRKYREQHHWKAYTMKRNKYICQLHYFKQQSISKRILDCKRDTKELFLLINKLTGNTIQNPLRLNKADEKLTKDFAKFFLSKIEKIRESFTNIPAYKAIHHDIPKFASFHPLTELEICTVIMRNEEQALWTRHHPNASTLKQILDACLPA